MASPPFALSATLAAQEPCLPDLFELQLHRVADDDVFHVSATIDEDTNLATGFLRELCEVPGKLRAGHLTRTHAPSKGGFESLELAGLETEGLTADVRNRETSEMAGS